MNSNPIRLAAATGLLTAALLIGGCGSSSHTTSTHNAARSGGSAAQPSVTAYINSVTSLQKAIPAASDPFFHGPAVEAARQRAARNLQQAYATAARRLSAMTPPTVAAAAQRHLVMAWSSAAASLARVIDHRPFEYGHAYEVAVAEEQPTENAYDEILTLP